MSSGCKIQWVASNIGSRSECCLADTENSLWFWGVKWCQVFQGFTVSKSLNVLWLERWIFLANSFFSNIWRSGIWPQDAPGHEVMPVPKGHGYVFAVEAKHCRGVRATQRTPTWRGLGIAMWTWSIFLGTVSKEYLGYEREGQLAKMKSKIRQMGQICWLSYLRV